MVFYKQHLQKVTDHWLTVDIILKLWCKALVIATHEDGAAGLSLFTMSSVNRLLAFVSTNFLISVFWSIF